MYGVSPTLNGGMNRKFDLRKVHILQVIDMIYINMMAKGKNMTSLRRTIQNKVKSMKILFSYNSVIAHVPFLHLVVPIAGPLAF